MSIRFIVFELVTGRILRIGFCPPEMTVIQADSSAGEGVLTITAGDGPEIPVTFDDHIEFDEAGTPFLVKAA